MFLAISASDAADVALAIFLIAVGLTLAFLFLRLAGVASRLSIFIKDTEQELLPLMRKTGVTIDKVNDELDKVAGMTDSAADAVEGVDHAVRAVNTAVKTPVTKIAGATAGLKHGFASLRARRGFKHAAETAKDAAARAQADLEDEILDVNRL